jgi:hypothetical protein
MLQRCVLNKITIDRAEYHDSSMYDAKNEANVRMLAKNVAESATSFVAVALSSPTAKPPPTTTAPPALALLLVLVEATTIVDVIGGIFRIMSIQMVFFIVSSAYGEKQQQQQQQRLNQPLTKFGFSIVRNSLSSLRFADASSRRKRALKRSLRKRTLFVCTANTSTNIFANESSAWLASFD